MLSAKWANAQGRLRSFEGMYSEADIAEYNSDAYNIYYYPNHPSQEKYDQIPVNPKSRSGAKRFITGTDIDVFEWVFVDMDLKQGLWPDKDTFIAEVLNAGLNPTKIIDSGNGTHAYWRVSDLDAKSFLRLSRRMCRRFNTDPAVTQIKQLMRVPNTINVKKEDEFKLCETLFEEENIYDCETLDKFLPPISIADEEFCQQHYDMTYEIQSEHNNVSEELPHVFLKLCRENGEVKNLFYNQQKDRSIADFRLGHLMQASGMDKEQARIVLMQTSKAAERTKSHRYTYAENIINKIWQDQDPGDVEDGVKSEFVMLSKSISELLNRAPGSVAENTRFPCHELVDATEHGFRLSEVLGLIGGQGNSKTTFCLNMFLWFIERNPDFLHLYVSLEQPEHEIANKWLKMTKNREYLHDKVHILGNYNKDGTYRDLSILDIQNYVLQLEKHLGRKIGALVIDHIGILRQEKTKSEFDGLTGVCKRLKSLAIATRCFTIIQSQTSREKNGGGDMELGLDAAFGTSSFESFCDYIMTIHQPLKRIYNRAKHMTVTAFQFPKIRHKDVLKDRIKADTVYPLKFEPETETLREMTSDEYKSFSFWSQQAATIRNRDRKKDPSQVSIIDWVKPRETKT